MSLSAFHIPSFWSTRCSLWTYKHSLLRVTRLVPFAVAPFLLHLWIHSRTSCRRSPVIRVPYRTPSLVSLSLTGIERCILTQPTTKKLVVIGGTVETARRASMSAWSGFVDCKRHHICLRLTPLTSGPSRQLSSLLRTSARKIIHMTGESRVALFRSYGPLFTIDGTG